MTKEEIEKIAALAHLEFSPDELESFMTQFEGILEFVRQLEVADSEDADPLFHALRTETPKTPYREDVVGPSLPRDEVLTQAPAVTEGEFRVPKVIE